MKSNVIIGSQTVGPGNPAFLIAEAGVNHDGNMGKAKRLVDAAHASGADALKFQSFVAERLIRLDAPKAKYQDRNIGTQKSQFQMLKEIEISKEQAILLKKYCDKKGILFLSTAYDPVAVDELEEMNVVAHKLASIETVNHPLIRKTARTGKPVILSVGMATEAEVRAAVAAFRGEAERTGTSPHNLILLQCNTNYPSRPEDQHLRAMETLRRFVPVVGFSDHTEGLTVSIGAIALGANMIERHFTLSKTDPGPDHKTSLEPDEFAQFVKAVRTMESALGTPEIRPRGGEVENIVGMRKSICAMRDITLGETITPGLLTAKRPGSGLYATDENLANIVGKKAARAIKEDENITFADVL